MLWYCSTKKLKILGTVVVLLCSPKKVLKTGIQLIQNVRTMTERHLRELPRKVGHSGTAGPALLKICQCYMQKPGVSCVQAQACPCRAAKHTCMSGFLSENCRNRSPNRTSPPGGRPQEPTDLRLTSNMNQKIKDSQEAAPILCHITPRSSFT